MSLLFFIVLSVSCLVGELIALPRLSDEAILLPPRRNDDPAVYRLRGFDGCFRWKWDHHDILSVLGEENIGSDCSTSALVISVALYSGRKESAVYAEDVYSGVTLRCKVFIDIISRIQIFHKSLVLDLDSLEILQVHAFDGEENEFSSLMGVEFVWHVMPETDGFHHHQTHHLVRLPMRDFGTDAILVRGVDAGCDMIYVNILDPLMDKVSDQIILTVKEAIVVSTSPLYVLGGALVEYTLKGSRSNIHQGNWPLNCHLMDYSFSSHISPMTSSRKCLVRATVQDHLDGTSHYTRLTVPTEAVRLQLGSLKTINLLAGAVNGKTFESSQYRYMNIHVHIEDNILELIDGWNQSSHSARLTSTSSFTIYGRFTGVTNLHVIARHQNGNEIHCQTVMVEVYALPVVHPPDIFLIPGGSFALTVKGGPRNEVVQYTSLNDSTVRVQESTGLVSALLPGITTVLATFYGSGRTIICQAYGEVKVGIPSEAMLNVQSEEVAIGREMHIFPLLIEGNLFSFYQLCNNYKWTIDNDQVLSFQHGFVDKQDVDFMKVLCGRSAGRSTVSVTFSCDFTYPGLFSYSRSYSASVTLRVIPDPPLSQGIAMTWILPPHYTTSSLLPEYYTGRVSYSIKHFETTNGDDGDVQQDAIAIFENKIKTAESNNVACILAKDHSTGRTEIAACVRVAEIAQIKISSDLTSRVINVAVGTELELRMNYYDLLGNPFLEAHNAVALHMEINYPDIVALSHVICKNGSVFLKALRLGRALVMVRFDDNPRKSDYIMVLVGAQLNPQIVNHSGTSLNSSVEGQRLATPFGRKLVEILRDFFWALFWIVASLVVVIFAHMLGLPAGLRAHLEEHGILAPLESINDRKFV